MNAMCLVMDRLHVGHVGAYGNSWIQTPVLDRFATEGFVFDRVLIDSPRLETLYRSYWQGWHALCARQPPEDRPSLAAMLREAGMHTALLTDEREVAVHPLALDFDELLQIDPPWQPEEAGQIEETHLARCVVQLIDWLEAPREPFLMWCHLAGLGTTWDAPREFRRAYWEQGDPEPPRSAEVPEETLPEDYDPDQLLGVSQAYAGQVSLLDTCLGVLLEVVAGSAAGRETMVVVAASRGFPLGEHGRVGPCDQALYGELVHVPLMIRFPDALGAGGRSQALVEPADLWATVLECCGVADRGPAPTASSLVPVIREEVEAVRDRLCVGGEGDARAIRTPAWYLRLAAEPELFAKPDDGWEVNNVFDRCHDVAERLRDELRQYEAALESGKISDLPPLSDILRNGVE